ncbi:putative PAS/PAC sensor protein [Salinarchaeum sp. Harcht-Bsk1]|uniref:PAS domain-containing protein n=1 Tax=Salinarchaeum sp. Harcht-Bsk1 TaxID=1333523 RepID=UPI0003423B9B|nr:PAS domain-containing protein [Salinarchaeum sp. Harcht-Bsk1]AGN01946.1 putative PAS/PAC sensor protein [Salinarchaeum sp. Harcht-Bsk1]
MASPSLTEALRETLSRFESLGEPRTTTEVADALDLGRRSTYERLERLVDRDRLETKKVGGNGRVWWRPPATADVPPDWSATAASLIDDVLDGAEVGIFVLDEDFEVAWINDATERYFGLDRDRVLGRDKRRLVEEQIAPVVDDSETFTDTVLATYDDNTSTEQFECRVTADDEARWLEHRSKPVETGAYAGGRVELYYDVTTRTEVERARERDRAQFESVVDAVEEYAIVMLDPDGHVQTWNEGAEQIMGYAAEDVVGEHFSTFYTDDAREAGVPEANLAAASSDGPVDDEGWRLRADGSRYWATVTITAHRDDDGAIDGYVKVTRDMTERLEHERKLQHERDLLDQVQEASPIGIGIFDTDGELYRGNRRFTELLGWNDADPSGYSLGEQPLLDADGDVIPYPERPAARALSTGDTVTDQRIRVDGPDGRTRWLSVNAKPVGGEVDGVVVTMTDVTRLEGQARRLERQRDDLQHELEDVFERIDDGFFALDADLQFEYVNERAGSLLDRSPSELVGTHVWDAVEAGSKAEAAFEEALETQESVSFEEYYEPQETWFENHVYPSESGLSVYFEDITERKERERQLERQRELLRHTERLAGTGGWETDVQTGNQRWTQGLFDMHDVDVDDPSQELVPTAEEYISMVAPEHRDAFRDAAERCMTEGESYDEEIPITTAEDRERWIRTIGVPIHEDGDVVALRGAAQDITERKQRERELEEYRRWSETLVENFPAGAVALVDRNLRYVTFAGTPEGDTDVTRTDLQGRRVRDALPEQIADTVVPAYQAALDGDPSEFVDTIDDRVYQFHFVPVRDDDGEVFAATAMSQDITQRVEHQRQLEQQRESLAALNNLNSVVRDITEAVIEQSTREEIERTVCERLADSESYLFAWTGEVDPASQTVDLRAEAGVEGYLDGVTISVDPDDERSEGPTGRAFRTGEPQVTQDIRADDRHDPWRDHVEQYEIRSSAAIPIAHEGTVYGVINVYADRPQAFEGQELAVISRLGEVVGHAIASVERKQALMSDELVELEFRIQDVFAGLDAPETDGTITFDQVVPVDDGEFLVYGTMAPDAVDTMTTLTEDLPHWEQYTIRSDGDPMGFELRMTDPPVVGVVASHGGYVAQAAIEDSDYRMAIHLAPSVDTRRIVDAVETAYSDAEMLRRRQISRVHEDRKDFQRNVVNDLTDRQRTALQTAYHAGFFEWPRDTTGEEVAEAIGVASPTFHQHLRKAERKVLDAMFSSPLHSVG